MNDYQDLNPGKIHEKLTEKIQMVKIKERMERWWLQNMGALRVTGLWM